MNWIILADVNAIIDFPSWKISMRVLKWIETIYLNSYFVTNLVNYKTYIWFWIARISNTWRVFGAILFASCWPSIEVFILFLKLIDWNNQWNQITSLNKKYTFSTKYLLFTSIKIGLEVPLCTRTTIIETTQTNEAENFIPGIECNSLPFWNQMNCN